MDVIGFAPHKIVWENDKDKWVFYFNQNRIFSGSFNSGDAAFIVNQLNEAYRRGLIDGAEMNSQGVTLTTPGRAPVEPRVTSPAAPSDTSAPPQTESGAPRKINWSPESEKKT